MIRGAGIQRFAVRLQQYVYGKPDCSKRIKDMLEDFVRDCGSEVPREASVQDVEHIDYIMKYLVRTYGKSDEIRVNSQQGQRIGAHQVKIRLQEIIEEYQLLNGHEKLMYRESYMTFVEDAEHEMSQIINAKEYRTELQDTGKFYQLMGNVQNKLNRRIRKATEEGFVKMIQYGEVAKNRVVKTLEVATADSLHTDKRNLFRMHEVQSENLQSEVRGKLNRYNIEEDVITSFAARNIAPIEVRRKRFHRKKVVRLVVPLVLVLVLCLLSQFLPVIIETRVSVQSTESESVEDSGDVVDILGDFVDERIENVTGSMEGIFDSAMLALLMIVVIVFMVGYGTYAILTLKHLNKRCDVNVSEYLNAELHAFLSGNYIEHQIKYKNETLYEQYEQEFIVLLGELCNGEEIIEKAAMEVEQDKIMKLDDEWSKIKAGLQI